MNSCCLTGRFTKDPELKVSKSGKHVCAFKLAVKRPRSKDTVDFIPFVAWEKNAEFISCHFKKGMKAEVAGTLRSSDYTDNDGNRKSFLEVLVSTIEFAERKMNRDEPVTSDGYGGYSGPAEGVNYYGTGGYGASANTFTPVAADEFEEIDDDTPLF